MKTKAQVTLSTDASDFLETLLWVAANPDDPNKRHIANWTVHEFHPEFVARLEAFLSGFREYLAKLDEENPGSEVYADPDAPDRTFGGNVFFSLSGHGVGFRDDRDSERGDALQAALEAYSGGKYRFEELECNLAKHNGKIHLAHGTAAARRDQLAKLFYVPPGHDTRWSIRYGYYGYPEARWAVYFAGEFAQGFTPFLTFSEAAAFTAKSHEARQSAITP
jgi:hypothetical protein